MGRANANYFLFYTCDVLCDVTDYTIKQYHVIIATIKYYADDATKRFWNILFYFIAPFILFYFTCANGFCQLSKCTTPKFKNSTLPSG